MPILGLVVLSREVIWGNQPGAKSRLLRAGLAALRPEIKNLSTASTFYADVAYHKHRDCQVQNEDVARTKS
jgi:hypothetical protein